MGKNVKIHLEGFGKNRLEKVFAEEDMREKSVQDLIRMVTDSEWQGEDKRTVSMIQQQMGASGGYCTKIDSRRHDLPVRLNPVGRDEPVLPYIERSPQREVVISVTGQHEVGYGCEYN